MSRFGDCDDCDDCDEPYPNSGELWAANARRALAGKRGKKALAELREALLALPEKRLIAGALCTVGGMERAEVKDGHRYYYQEDMQEKLTSEGEGVCAIGAYLWFKKVKAGADPEAALADLPVPLDTSKGGWATADAGKAAGLTYSLAYSLAYRNDETYSMSPEVRYTQFLAWLDKQIETGEVAA